MPFIALLVRPMFALSPPSPSSSPSHALSPFTPFHVPIRKPFFSLERQEAPYFFNILVHRGLCISF